MITIKNVKTLAGKSEDISVKSDQNQTIDAEGKLLVFPGLIDTNVSFKGDWVKGSQSAIWGGITTVFETPSPESPCSDPLSFQKKKQEIDKQLARTSIPLSYRLYIESESIKVETLGQLQGESPGLIIDMELSPKLLERSFQLAAQENVISIVHLKKNRIKSLEQALLLTEKYNGIGYISPIETKEEVEMIHSFKKKGLIVYAETSPRALFSGKDTQFLLDAIKAQKIDTIGSGDSQIELTLPFLLNAVHQKKISLEDIVKLMRLNPEGIFNLPRNQDFVLVNTNQVKDVNGHSLHGWPVYTIIKGQLFKIG